MYVSFTPDPLPFATLARRVVGSVQDAANREPERDGHDGPRGQGAGEPVFAEEGEGGGEHLGGSQGGVVVTEQIKLRATKNCIPSRSIKGRQCQQEARYARPVEAVSIGQIDMLDPLNAVDATNVAPRAERMGKPTPEAYSAEFPIRIAAYEDPNAGTNNPPDCPHRSGGQIHAILHNQHELDGCKRRNALEPAKPANRTLKRSVAAHDDIGQGDPLRKNGFFAGPVYKAGEAVGIEIPFFRKVSVATVFGHPAIEVLAAPNSSARHQQPPVCIAEAR
jgi:hypothetical protein